LNVPLAGDIVSKISNEDIALIVTL